MTGLELAVLTSAATTLALEAMKGLGQSLGKAAGSDVWKRVKLLLGWSDDPPVSELPKRIAERLIEQPALATELEALLKENPTSVYSAQMVGRLNVGHVSAKNAVIAERVDRLDMH